MLRLLRALPLCLLLLPAAAPAATPASPRSVEFIGFSRNEKVSAWRIHQRRRQADGGWDTYSLVRLISIESNALLATFQAPPLRHLDRRGRPSPVPMATLLRRNPAYARATSAQAWRKTKRIGRFAAIAQEFKDTVVRLAVDMDSKLDAEAGTKELRIVSKAGAPLGYTPICRLFEGEMISLGHYRLDRTPLRTQPLRAHLRVYYSHTGRLIAALNAFETPNGDVSDALVVTTHPDDPIGATGVGLLPMVEAQSRSLYNSFKKVHPEQIQTYRRYIGKFF